MDAADELQEPETLLWTERVVGIPARWALLAAGIFLIVSWEWEGFSGLPAAVLAAYAVHTVILTVVLRRGMLSARVVSWLSIESYIIDFCFVGYLAFGIRGIDSSAAFLLYGALIFKAALHYPWSRASLVIVPVAVILYLVMMGMQGGMESFGRYTARARIFLLVCLPLFTLYAARVLELRQRHMDKLNHRLRNTSAELRRHAEELQTIISGMHDGLLVTDGGSRVLALNPVGRAILRLQPNEAIPTDVARRENFRSVQAVVAEALASANHTGRRDITLALPLPGEEEPRTYQALASRIQTDGPSDSHLVVLIMRDITEQNRLEMAKSNFLSVVSHELRTPLNAIKGFLSIVLAHRAGPLTETQQEFLTIVSGQAEYLLVAINDLVEYSRIQLRRDAMESSPVVLRDIAVSVSARLFPLAAAKEIKIRNDVPDRLPSVRGDSFRLDQVVSNLVTNAIKFSPEGSTVFLTASAEDGEVHFSVRDEGIGIPADQQDSIFEAFYQVSAGPARLHDGMGLGLAICRHIVEGCGGRLVVHSEEGKGSTFTFSLQPYPVDDLVNWPSETHVVGAGSRA